MAEGLEVAEVGSLLREPREVRVLVRGIVILIFEDDH
jgi:hypothetical protein